MKILQTICLALLLSTFSSAYAGDCFKDGDYDVVNCRIKAKQGNAEAQYYLGGMYKFGHGVTQNYTEAVKWYRLAAKQGNAKAQALLGAAYSLGQGVPKNYKEAVKWLTLSAKQGEATAQYFLGLMSANGEGVPKSVVMAHMYWNIAGANGDELAIKLRDNVEKEMTPSQIEKAQDLAIEWMKKH